MTLPLSTILRRYLDDRDNISLDDKACDEGSLFKEVLKQAPKAGFVEYPGRVHPELKFPQLWNYNAWQSCVAKYESDKKKSHEERVAKFIFDENMKQVTYHLANKYHMTEDMAALTANMLLKKGMITEIKAAGIKNIVESEEDL